MEIEVSDASGPWTGPEHCCGAAQGARRSSEALTGSDGWITGLRREQVRPRARTPQQVECDERPRPVEGQPARALDRAGGVEAYHRARSAVQPAARPGLRLDRLRARARCRATAREGRWAGTAKTECGLHVSDVVAERALHAPRGARGRGDPRHPRGRRRARAAGAAVQRRQGLDRAAAAGARRRSGRRRSRSRSCTSTRAQLPRGHRVPRPARGRARRAADRRLRAGRRSTPARVQRGDRPAASRNRLQTRDAARRDRPSTASTPPSAARAATRSAPARRSACCPSATTSAAGTRARSGPSCGRSTTAAIRRGEHVRVFPISNWTELDVWQYIAQEELELPSIYFAHEREVFERDGMLSRSPSTSTVNGDERVHDLGALPHGRRHDAAPARCARTARDARRTSWPRSPRPGSPSAARRAPTTACRSAAMEDRKREGYF